MYKNHSHWFYNEYSETKGYFEKDATYVMGSNIYLKKIKDLREKTRHPRGWFIPKTAKKEIRFDNDSDTVALSARLKDREKKVDGENWNPNSWSKFIERIIVELDLNVVFTTIKNEKKHHR